MATCKRVGKGIQLIQEESSFKNCDWENSMDSGGSELGTQKVFYAIKSRHPELTDQQVHQMVDVVLDQVAKRIGSGDALAFFHLDENDQAEVITYSMEPRNRKHN